LLGHNLDGEARIFQVIGRSRTGAVTHEAAWLSLEPDPHDLLITYASEPMTMWPISTRVNKPDRYWTER
jgi:hypothetical protein